MIVLEYRLSYILSSNYFNYPIQFRILNSITVVNSIETRGNMPIKSQIPALGSFKEHLQSHYSIHCDIRESISIV